MLLVASCPSTGVRGSSLDDLQKNIDELQQTQQDLQQQMDNVQNEQNSLQKGLSDTQAKVGELETRKQALEQNMKEIDQQLGAAVKEMSDVAAQEEAKQKEIDATNTELARAEETEHQQYENMKLRIRYMYESGNQKYLSVLLSAADASDLLTRAEYITSIYRYDRKMLTRYEDAKKVVADQKAILSNQYRELEKLKTQAEKKKTAAEQLLAKKNEELQKYNETIKANQELVQEYEKQIAYRDDLFAQLEAAAYDASVQRDAAISSLTSMFSQMQEAQRSQAESAAAQAVLKKMADAEQQKLNAQGYTITVDPNSLFVWPCPSSTRITSPYGWRTHPIYGDMRFHNGIDIGADMGTAIIAAYRGTVIGAGYDSSMGNYVMVDHGEGLVTIYMHASYLCVSQGDVVETGQMIALVGATGDATGPHLHFTVRLNGNYVSPWNYVSN